MVTYSQSIWTKGSTCNANWFKFFSVFQQKLSTLSKACDVTWPENCKQTLADSSISSVPFVLNIQKNEMYENFLNTKFFVNLYKIVKFYYICWWNLWMLPPVLTVCILFAGNWQQQPIQTQIFLRTVSMGIVCWYY